jgi:hypothetical protein
MKTLKGILLPRGFRWNQVFCTTGKGTKGLLHDLTKALVLQLRFFVKNFLRAAIVLARTPERTRMVLLTPEAIYFSLATFMPLGLRAVST